MTLRVVIAGGGTGGHLFPGIALAEEFTTRHAENDVLFVGTERGLEKEVVPAQGYPIEFIRVAGLNRVGWRALIRGLLRLPGALWQSWRILGRYRPGIVIAVGGYASGPVALAAWLRRIPVVVQEQNALPGFTTRTVGRFATRVFIAFKEAASAFKPRKVMLTGNPIRQSLVESLLTSAPRSEEPTVLVFGGSQGARAINEAMVPAAKILSAGHPGLRVLHQTGAAEEERVRQAYAEAGLADQVTVTAFIDDMSAAYRDCRVVVCRAGATTIAELTICHKASILIPFPFAADNHQDKNARSLSDVGAAVLLTQDELTPERLAEEIDGLMLDPQRRAKMERAAGELGHPEAAREIADTCVAIWMATGGFAREQQAMLRKERR